MEIRLIRPSAAYAERVMDFRREMLAGHEPFDGCAGLEETDSFEEWTDFEERLKKKYGKGYVPSEVFLAVRDSDGLPVGIIDYRHPLSDFLFRYGGNIGYSVRPSERRKGYATQMLGLMLSVCKEYGETSVLITCEKQNEASRRTIIRNGGVLENEVENTVGLGEGGIIQRYRIDLR